MTNASETELIRASQNVLDAIRAGDAANAMSVVEGDALNALKKAIEAHESALCLESSLWAVWMEAPFREVVLGHAKKESLTGAGALLSLAMLGAECLRRHKEMP